MKKNGEQSSIQKEVGVARIEKIVNQALLKGSKCFILVLSTLLMLEVAASVTLYVYRKTKGDTVGLSELPRPEAAKEITKLHQEMIPSPYRWYKLTPNYNSKNIITDSSGFRINSAKIDQREQVGFYGGSTAFSVLTEQKDTIPDYMTALSKKYQFLNFGIGGYSSGAEIMTFIESLRLYPNIKYAIFYDGVNELGRSNDTLPFRRDRRFTSEKIIGFPFTDGLRQARENSLPIFSFNPTSTQLYYIYEKFLQQGPAWKEAKEERSQRIRRDALIYLKNISVIRSICREMNVKCFFMWQPNIHTLQGSDLNTAEKNIRNSDFWGSHYPEMTKIVLTEARAQGKLLFSLIDSLNGKTSQVFYDGCHLNKTGNKLIAEKILNTLKPFMQ